MVSITEKFCANNFLQFDEFPDVFIFQQDSSPAHRTRKIVEFLRRETLDFIEPEMWPHSSPDLNPVDYKIWVAIQQHAYHTKMQTVNRLKQRLVDVWRGLEQHVIMPPPR